MSMKVHAGEMDRYKKTFPLFIDEEEWKTLHVSIFGRNPKFGIFSSQEELIEKFSVLEYKGSRNFIIRRLALKNYHSQELSAALKRRGVSCDTVDRVICEFLQQGYLNDEAWLASYIRGLRLQRFGFNSILLKLRHKGIPKESALLAISEIKENEGEGQDERASIDKLLETRYKNRDLSVKKERDKVIAALMRKGYGLDDIFCKLNRFMVY
jgi:regulatory protein